PVRILVVEDSAKMAGLLEKGLAREGYAVDVVASGVDAIWMATEHDYDAVVLDVILQPGDAEVDGFEVCRRLRGASRWTPVLMVTARDAVEDRVRGLDCGADDYLAKPFSLPELLARVRALIRRGGGERPVVLKVGDLSLDPARHHVRRGSCGVPLPQTEFGLLESLRRPPGKALTRQVLAGALRPVERMRREAAAISATDPGRRLSPPAGKDELSSLAATLNLMLDRIEESVNAERQLVDRASHELRTPLAIQRMDLDLALTGPQTVAELSAALQSVSGENAHLARLTEDLLVLSRARSGAL